VKQNLDPVYNIAEIRSIQLHIRKNPTRFFSDDHWAYAIKNLGQNEHFMCQDVARWKN